MLFVSSPLVERGELATTYSVAELADRYEVQSSVAGSVSLRAAEEEHCGYRAEDGYRAVGYHC